MDGCNTSFLLGWPIFRGYVKLQVGTFLQDLGNIFPRIFASQQSGSFSEISRFSSTKCQQKQHHYRVGGWTNPFEKYQSKCIISPNRDENKTYLKPPTSYVAWTSASDGLLWLFSDDKKHTKIHDPWIEGMLSSNPPISSHQLADRGVDFCLLVASFSMENKKSEDLKLTWPSWTLKKKPFERLIFPSKYVIPKSLKFSHWPSKEEGKSSHFPWRIHGTSVYIVYLPTNQPFIYS